MVQDTMKADFPFYEELVRGSVDKRVLESYQKGCATAPSLAAVAGGSTEVGTVWTQGLSDGADFATITAAWKNSGANLQPPELRASLNDVDELLGGYKRFCDTFKVPLARTSLDMWYADKKTLITRINTTLAEGLAIWCMHTLTPISRVKAQLLLEQPQWEQQEVTLHKSIEECIKRVMRLRKP